MFWNWIENFTLEKPLQKPIGNLKRVKMRHVPKSTNVENTSGSQQNSFLYLNGHNGTLIVIGLNICFVKGALGGPRCL